MCSPCGVCSITLSSWLPSDRNPTPPAETEQSRCQFLVAAPTDHRTHSGLHQHKRIPLPSGSRKSEISFPSSRCRGTGSFWRPRGAPIRPLIVLLLVFPGLRPQPSERIAPRSLFSVIKQPSACYLQDPCHYVWGHLEHPGKSPHLKTFH